MQDTAKSQGLRIASYNIRKAKGLDRQRNPGRILDVINTLDADIVALQEADMRLGNRPAAIDPLAIAQHTDFNVVAVAQTDVSLGWHGNAVLLRKGLQAKNVHHIALPGLEPRGAVRVDLSGPSGISIVALHLGLTRRSRRQQLKTIATEVADIPHAVLIGDFNEWSRARGLEPLKPRFTVHAPGRTFHAARPIAALDRIALTNGISLQDAGTCETPLSRKASDHLPIWADIARVA